MIFGYLWGTSARVFSCVPCALASPLSLGLPSVASKVGVWLARAFYFLRKCIWEFLESEGEWERVSACGIFWYILWPWWPLLLGLMLIASVDELWLVKVFCFQQACVLGGSMCKGERVKVHSFSGCHLAVLWSLCSCPGLASQILGSVVLVSLLCCHFGFFIWAVLLF